MLNEWEMQDKATMRLTHTPGEKLFIDFSGDKPSWINPETGELMTPELYVAVLAVPPILSPVPYQGALQEREKIARLGIPLT